MLLYLFPIRLCKGKQFLCYFFIVYHSCEQWEEVRGASHLTSPARVPLQCLSGVSASSTNRHLTGVWQPGKVVILEWTWLKVSQLFLCSVFYSPHSLDRLLNPEHLVLQAIVVVLGEGGTTPWLPLPICSSPKT